MNKNEFIQFVRKYPTYELLKCFSKLSIEMYDAKQPFKFENVPYYYKNGIKAGSVDFCYNQHELLNLCYYSILYGNDYRQRKIEKSDIVNLLNKLKKYKDECSAKDTKVAEKHIEFFAILFNEQIQFQRLNLSVKLFDRLCFIMDYINKKYTEHPEYIDFEKETKSLIDMTVSDYNEINLFLTLLTMGSKNPDLTDMLDNIDLDFSRFNFCKEKLYDLINMDSNDYDFYRKNDNESENWNFLKYAPLVKTKKTGHIIMVNIYSFIICFSTKLYWMIRNKYKSIGTQKFTNYFGYCFEMYVKELLEYYDIDNYKKIKEGKEKQPDWFIETDEFNIVIEQKASLFTIGSRDTTLENKYEELAKFVKTVKKAMSQLSKYKSLNKKQTIRICLTFEQVDGIECIQELALNKLDIRDKYLYWLINIADFEKLIYLVKNDYEEAKRIIYEKIKLEQTKDPNGRSLEKLLPEENDYIKNRIDYFYDISNAIVEKLKPNIN